MITYRKLETTIVGQIDGKPFSLTRTDAVEAKIKELAAGKHSYEDVEQLVKISRSETIAGKNEFLVYSPLKNQYYLHYNKVISKFPIPESLVKYIEDSFDKNIDYMPIIKAWARLLANPRISQAMIGYFNDYITSTFTDENAAQELIDAEGFSMAEALNMCTYPDIAITQEGMLATYKVADIVTWEYVMEEDEDGNWVKVKNPKYEIKPAVLDPVTGEELEEEFRVLPEFKEDILFTPAIYKHGDKFFSGDKLGYVYEVGKIQRLPKKALRNLKNTFGGGGLSMCSFN